MYVTPARSVRDAIGVITEWTAQRDGSPDLLIETLRSHLDTRPPRQAIAEATGLIMGLVTLCGTLLALNDDATGRDVHATLQELALYYVED